MTRVAYTKAQPHFFRIKMQKEFIWPIRIYYEDTDAGGIVYHSNYLKFFERTRTEYLRALGWNQQELKANGVCAFVVSSLSIRYKRPARLDDEITVTAQIKRVRRASFTIEQKAIRGDTLLAQGEVDVACIDPQTGIPIPIPQSMYEQVYNSIAD